MKERTATLWVGVYSGIITALAYFLSERLFGLGVLALAIMISLMVFPPKIRMVLKDHGWPMVAWIVTGAVLVFVLDIVLGIAVQLPDTWWWAH